MIYALDKDGLRELAAEGPLDGQPCVGVVSGEAAQEQREALGLPESLFHRLFFGSSCKLESHDGFDFISLYIPLQNKRVAIYYRQNFLLFLYDREEDREFLLELGKAMKLGEGQGRMEGNGNLEHLLYGFFDRLTEGDTLRLQEIEQEVFQMEEGVVGGRPGDYMKQIMDYRRCLMDLARYYEQLLDVAGGILENENSLFSSKILRLFHMVEGRWDRLADGVVHLKDYLSQVREGYQAQVDTRQNKIMQLFTVITAIFLPLTLLVGWYGMNLQMPEFGWVYTYPVVIGGSVLIVVGCIVYFKKNKWF